MDEFFRTLAEQAAPCYVFDEDALTERMRACREIVGPTVELCYSIKANPFLIPAMLRCVPTLEVCSPGELEICNALRVPPEAVLYSGVNKTAEGIARALDLGVRRFTCESPLHVQLLDEAARARNLELPVLLRLSSGSQFGMEEAVLREIVRHRDTLPGLHIEGLHYFAGTQQKRLTGQRRQLEKLAALCDALEREEGFALERVEYGAGLYLPYFEGEDEDTLVPLRELAPDLARLAARVKLTVEMGRFFAGPCGTFLTRVVDVKHNAGSDIAILDSGIHHVNYYGGSMGMRVPKMRVLRDPSQTTGEPWMLCGSLCTTADVLVRAAPVGPLAPGDALAFEHVGAYAPTEAPGLFLSRDLPRVFLLSQGHAHLVRDAVPAWQLNCPQPD